tara:strand:- start:2914 stop:3132 length:219 start_codon:yes stop_codon:yes gene_type:complete
MKTFNTFQNATLNLITLMVYSMAVRVLIDIWVNNVNDFRWIELTYASASSIFVAILGWFLLLINISVWKENK